MASALKKLFIFILLVNLGILMLVVNTHYDKIVYSLSRIVNTNSLYDSCEFQLLDNAAQVASEYLAKSAGQRMPLYSKCMLNDTQKRKELAITYMTAEKSYLISVNFTALETRIGKAIQPQTITCFIQFFEKTQNSSEKGEQISFEKKQLLNANFEIRVSDTGFFYINCADKEKASLVVYHDVFTILPHDMRELVEKRAKYKKTVEDFKLEKVVPKLGDLIKNVDYANKCAAEKKQEKLLRPNILLMGIDSVSYANFKRLFPQTFRFLSAELANNVILDHMNAVGGSTIDNIIPFLTGLTYDELINRIDSKFDNTFVDFLPFLTYDFEDIGYVTSFQEDLPSIGIFNYLRDGFRHFPTHFYARGYWSQYFKVKTKYQRIKYQFAFKG